MPQRASGRARERSTEPHEDLFARRAQKVLTHNGACLRLACGPFGLLLCGHESRKAWGRRVATGGPSLFQGALTPLELIENATMRPQTDS
jgi:hypothetical protein